MEDIGKNKLLQFAEEHPYVLLASTSILIIVILIIFLYSNGFIMERMNHRKSKKTSNMLDDEVEMDDLIISIKNKQGME